MIQKYYRQEYKPRIKTDQIMFSIAFFDFIHISKMDMTLRFHYIIL
jgi:hypothetical protein